VLALANLAAVENGRKALAELSGILDILARLMDDPLERMSVIAMRTLADLSGEPPVQVQRDILSLSVVTFGPWLMNVGRLFTFGVSVFGSW